MSYLLIHLILFIPSYLFIFLRNNDIIDIKQLKIFITVQLLIK